MSERTRRRSGKWLYIVVGLLIAVGAWAMLRPDADDNTPPPADQAQSPAATMQGQPPAKVSAAEPANPGGTPVSPNAAAPGYVDRLSTSNLTAESPEPRQLEAPSQAPADQSPAPGAAAKGDGGNRPPEPPDLQRKLAGTPASGPAVAGAAPSEPGSDENQPPAQPTPATTAKPASPPAPAQATATKTDAAQRHAAGEHPKADRQAKADQPAKADQSAKADHSAKTDQQAKAGEPAKTDQAEKKEDYAKLVRKAHTTEQLLQLARDQLRSGTIKAAADALERAETLALNRLPAGQAASDQLTEIQRARAYLTFGNKDGALRNVGAALQVPRPTPTVARHAASTAQPTGTAAQPTAPR